MIHGEPSFRLDPMATTVVKALEPLATTVDKANDNCKAELEDEEPGKQRLNKSNKIKNHRGGASQLMKE